LQNTDVGKFSVSLTIVQAIPHNKLIRDILPTKINLNIGYSGGGFIEKGAGF
jgi:hypothetical protein